MKIGIFYIDNLLLVFGFILYGFNSIVYLEVKLNLDIKYEMVNLVLIILWYN